MRIAIDLTALAGNYSGIEQYAHHITEELIAHGEENSYVLLFLEEIFPQLADAVQLPWVETCVLHPYFKNKLAVLQLSVPLALSRVKADAYLFPAFPQPLAFFSRRAVTVLHDVSFWDCPQTLTRQSLMYWRASARRIAHQPLLFTVSEFSKSRIAQKLHIDPKRIVVAYNGIDPRFAAAREEKEPAFYQVIRERYGLPDHFVLSLCTLEPRKNLSLLVDAWVLARQANAQTPDLVLAGRKGWKVDKLLESVPHHLLDSIHLAGFIEHEDLPHLYHLCDRFVFPSLYEGFGLPPLEALAAGACVFCSDIEAFHETCGDSVTFFPVDDAQALARLLAEPSPTRPAERDVCERFNWERSARTVLDALSGLMHELR